MANSRSHQLLDLPDEILITIFGYLDFNTLPQAILVCKHFGDLAQPFLFHSIKILTGRQGAALSASFRARPQRATWVRSFLVSTRFEEDEGLCGLPPFIAQMANLQDLRLETPDCNKKYPEERVGWVALQDRYERVFEGASALIPKSAVKHLPNLRSCK